MKFRKEMNSIERNLRQFVDKKCTETLIHIGFY